MRLLRILALTLQAGVAFLVGAGLLAAYIPPEGVLWWTAMAAVLLPFVVWLLIGSTVLALATRAWIAAGIGIVLLVMAGTRLLPLERTAPVEAGPDDLVLMTFNVPRHGPTAEQLAADLYGLVRAEQPHLMGLQATSAWRPAQSGYRAAVADYVRPAVDSLGYRLAIPHELPRERTPQPILTRTADGPTILTQEAITLEHEPGDVLATQAVRTHFRWQNRDAVHYNVHLRGFGPEKPWESDAFPRLAPREWLPFIRRYRQAYQRRAADIRTLRARIDEEALPVIVAGDLNATPNNWDYRIMRQQRTDAFAAAGVGPGRTYHARRPLVRIDYVLADSAFEIVSAHVPDVRFSDHRPVVARLRWRNPDGE